MASMIGERESTLTRDVLDAFLSSLDEISAVHSRPTG